MSDWLYEFTKGFVYFLVYATIFGYVGSSYRNWSRRKEMAWFAEKLKRAEKDLEKQGIFSGSDKGPPTDGKVE